MEGGRDGGGQRQMYEITCSNCGKKDSVPFQPRGDRPVLCGDCFRKQREQGGDQRGPSRDVAPSEPETLAEEPQKE